MLNQLLKFTLISSLLLWLKPRWRSLLAFCVLVILVHVLHGEYLGYVELTGDRSFLIWSYIVKWMALIAGLLIYILYTISGPKARTLGAKESKIRKEYPTKSNPIADDGFDFLREKKHLQNRAEKIITQKKCE